nr:MAG TPA: hypothetical protein [Caudoviricetes sp.]
MEALFGFEPVLFFTTYKFYFVFLRCRFPQPTQQRAISKHTSLYHSQRFHVPLCLCTSNVL